MDQGVRYVVTLSDVNVTSGLRSMESSARRTEGAIVSLNDALGGMRMLGLSIGMHEIFGFGKDAVQGAAEYETAVKRIKFASENFADGLTNIKFINAEVDKFKIPLQSATDAYGKFLAMLNGSGIAAEQVRQLHDQVLTIGKVKGLDEGQLNAAAMNIGKMLEAGGLDARHFRPLEQQLSGIGAYVARELGISVHQLAVLRNKGHMAEIDPKVLLTAIRKQAEDLSKFLPESTNTIASQLADLDNAWLRFKNDLVFDNINELKSLFEALKEGVQWLKEHEGTIIHVGKILLDLGKFWVEYKAAMIALNLYQSGSAALNELLTGKYLTNAAKEVTATEARTAAFGQLTAAMEANNAAMQQATVYGAAGLGRAGIPLLAAGEAEAAAGAAVAAEVGTVSIAAAVSTAIPVVFGLLAGGYLINQLGEYLIKNFSPQYNPAEASKGANNPNAGVDPKHADKWAVLADVMGDPSARASWDQIAKAEKKKADKKTGTGDPAYDAAAAAVAQLKASRAKDPSMYKIAPPNDKITGQHVVTYNIHIGKINGQEIANQEVVGDKADTESVALKLRDIILSIVNDSQIRDGH